MTNKSLYDLDYNEMSNMVQSMNQAQYRTKQIWNGLYNQLWTEINQFNILSREFRNEISENFSIFDIYNHKHLKSQDKTTEKVLFKLKDGNKIEAVLMLYDRRQTLCISSQSGCAMGCSFCATGQMGFFRNLSSGEIIQQIIYFAKILKQRSQTITNIVFMGMGEPFHNYDEVIKAVYQLNHPSGMNLGIRRFTISTVGLIPAIRRFIHEHHQINLAISLHATKDEERINLIPIARRYPVNELLQVCLEYVNNTGRRITFEWALIENLNDSVDHAKELCELLLPFLRPSGSMCHVNIIPLNPTKNFTGKSTTKERASRFQETLISKKIPCTIRTRRGIDIFAGCGQLANWMD